MYVTKRDMEETGRENIWLSNLRKAIEAIPSDLPRGCA